ncbi:MAG TPA: NACHT domain-containing protein, partial [Pirellulaceae bacterium]|nr:NACHT domain-containing protein [Pirellulaceae bacterium]
MAEPMTTVGTTAVALSAPALKKAIELVVSDIYAQAKGSIAEKVKRWRNRGRIDTLYKKLKQIRYVKTIWQLDKEIDLLRFYHPTSLVVEGSRIQINDLSKVPYGGNFIIEGTVGQGKSIFLRYLASCELAKGQAVPLFVELRRVASQHSLNGLLLDELRNLGLDSDESVLEFLASTGRLILFLDGFDEIHQDRRMEVISSLEWHRPISIATLSGADAVENFAGGLVVEGFTGTVVDTFYGLRQIV